MNDVLERQTGRIELLDVEVKTGKDLLFFMYSGKMKEGSDLPGLLVLADKYDIQVNCCVIYHTLCRGCGSGFGSGSGWIRFQLLGPDSYPDSQPCFLHFMENH